MSKKIIFLDCETTGLDQKDQDGYTLLAHELHSIVELSGLVDVDGVLQSKFQLLAAPRPNDPIDPRALEVNGLTEEELRTRPPQVELYKGFVHELDKHVDPFNKEDKYHIVAYNAAYDWGFLRQLFDDHGDKYMGSWFWFPYIDFMQVAAMAMLDSDTRHLLPNMKLATVAEYLGVRVNKDMLHNGMYDCRLVRQMFYKLMEEEGDG